MRRAHLKLRVLHLAGERAPPDQLVERVLLRVARLRVIGVEIRRANRLVRFLCAILGFPGVGFLRDVLCLVLLAQVVPDHLHPFLRQVGVVGAVVGDEARLKQGLSELHRRLYPDFQPVRRCLLQGRSGKRRWCLACLRFLVKGGHYQPRQRRLQHCDGNVAVGDVRVVIRDQRTAVPLRRP